MFYKAAKLVLLVIAVWFAWVTWKAVPHFSEGVGEGLDYYRYEFSLILDEFASAGEKILGHARSTMDSLGFTDEVTAKRPGARFRGL